MLTKYLARRRYHIVKSCKNCCRFLFSKEETFDGDLSIKRQKESVPLPLLNLVSLIIDGETTIDNTTTNAAKAATNLAQLLRFNAVKIKWKSDRFLRHSKSNEPPLPVSIGLMVHAKTRKRSMVEKLAAEGLSVSYKRVQDIQTSIASQLCAKFNKDGMVCPPTLQKGLFINAAIDNIDHDPSSTGAKSSFHGTSISVFQHVESETIDSNCFKLELGVEDEPGLSLPKSYTDIMPLISSQPKYPANNQPHQLSKETSQVTSESSEWINALVDIC